FGVRFEWRFRGGPRSVFVWRDVAQVDLLAAHGVEDECRQASLRRQRSDLDWTRFGNVDHADFSLDAGGVGTVGYRLGECSPRSVAVRGELDGRWPLGVVEVGSRPRGDVVARLRRNAPRFV